MAWSVITLNFILVNTMLGVTLAALLRGLESSLQKERKSGATLHRFWMAVEQASDIIVLVDAAGKPEYVNGAFERVFGVSPEKALLQGDAMINVVLPEENTSRGLPYLLETCSTVEMPLTIRRADGGALVRVQAVVFPLFADDDAPAGDVIVMRDESRELSLEDRLRRVEKMEAVGTLAGGIAHDFNNILTSILGHSELLGDALKGEPERLLHVDEIETASLRARELIRQILTFTRQMSSPRVAMDVNTVLEEALSFLRPSLPSTIEIVSSAGNPPCMVMASPTEVHQVFMNLCTNAYHAMEGEGGTLTVRAESIRVDRIEQAQCPELTVDAPYIRIQVSDTGCGMNPRTLERAFEPYYSTKVKEKGTGLGLATVHGIALQLDGGIAAKSAPGQGTTMSVYIPEIVSNQASPSAQLARTTKISPGAGRRVLVVDDEEVLRNLIERILLRSAYEVKKCGGGEEALEAVRATPAAWDLVITDMTMPGMTGMALCEEIHRVRKDLPVILTSGFSELMSPAELEKSGIATFLYKPFTQNALGAAIDAALGTGTSDAN